MLRGMKRGMSGYCERWLLAEGSVRWLRAVVGAAAARDRKIELCSAAEAC
jgi:hypothetical protein